MIYISSIFYRSRRKPDDQRFSPQTLFRGDCDGEKKSFLCSKVHNFLSPLAGEAAGNKDILLVIAPTHFQYYVPQVSLYSMHLFMHFATTHFALETTGAHKVAAKPLQTNYAERSVFPQIFFSPAHFEHVLVYDERGPVQREGPYPDGGEAPGEDPPAALLADLPGAVEHAAVAGVHGVVRL